MPSKGNDTRSVGFKGEKYAEQLLKDNGYKIVERNFYSKLGEIDIIAKDGRTLVFVEVKLRKSRKLGFPEESVNVQKLRRIERTGQYYIMEKKIKVDKLRIDIVSILLKNDKLVRVRLIKGVYLW